MKPGGGKQKGSQWERDFSKALSCWWTFDKDPDVFWRTHSSGARHGISEECGDIMAVKECGNPLMDFLIIELKCVNDSDMILDMIRHNKKSKMWEWWNKLCEDSAKWKKVPLLVVKLSRRTTICMFDLKHSLVSKKRHIDIVVDGMFGIMEWDVFLTNTMLGELRDERVR